MRHNNGNDESDSEFPTHNFADRPVSEMDAAELAAVHDSLENAPDADRDRLEALADEICERAQATDDSTIHTAHVTDHIADENNEQQLIVVIDAPDSTDGPHYHVPRPLARWGDRHDLVLRNVEVRPDEQRVLVAFAALSESPFAPRARFADAMRPFFAAGISTAPAIDAWMTAPDDVSQSYWARWRGVSQQAVNDNVGTAVSTLEAEE